MEMIPLLMACQMLGIDKTTLFRWLKDCKINPHTPVSGDKRMRMLSRAQIEILAAIHRRALPENAPDAPEPVAEAVQWNSVLLLLARVATLESEVDALTGRLERVESERHNLASLLPEKPLQASGGVGVSGALPADYAVLSVFAKMHGIPETSALRAAKAGKLPIIKGRWKYGRVHATIALNADGQAAFVEMFRAHPQFVGQVGECQI